MRPFTTILPLLTSFALAGQPLDKVMPSDSFLLVDKKHPISTGCDVDIINVCGCTKSVNVDTWHTCDSGGRKHTQEGKVCEGWWKLDGNIMRIERPGCKAACTIESQPSPKIDNQFLKYKWCKAEAY